MAKEGSVAPQERVNIVYKSHIGDAVEDVELPLKLLMVGDYTLREEEEMIENRKPVNVDKDNFNEVMGGMNLGLTMQVPNKLAPEDTKEEMPVTLKFGTIRDFEPENVARQIPELNALLQLREAMTALKGPLGNIPGFRKKIQALLGDDDARRQLMAELGIGG